MHKAIVSGLVFECPKLLFQQFHLGNGHLLHNRCCIVCFGRNHYKNIVSKMVVVIRVILKMATMTFCKSFESFLEMTVSSKVVSAWGIFVIAWRSGQKNWLFPLSPLGRLALEQSNEPNLCANHLINGDTLTRSRPWRWIYYYLGMVLSSMVSLSWHQKPSSTCWWQNLWEIFWYITHFCQ